MSWSNLIHALAIFFVLEGVFPFAFPKMWVENFSKLLSMPIQKIRILGFSMMLIGVFLSLVAHNT
ncbi:MULTISPECIES: DUF2065 domain-containing protein [Candidatus Ichthyocystis]|uniref:DUF2065 domain-containing protein n=1 Tax=Candidatus Ichthyocystis hellenicum TaxID=1561003 RepID=A0A0S4M2Q3_9BURK|nr:MULTISPECIES: DUF2065 domain-containing protein [Ichthyocystis]CUT17905.1 hypothetical protein, DUF2065 family [Candidatus Ichthyocystis hellenicum]